MSAQESGPWDKFFGFVKGCAVALAFLGAFVLFLHLFGGLGLNWLGYALKAIGEGFNWVTSMLDLAARGFRGFMFKLLEVLGYGLVMTGVTAALVFIFVNRILPAIRSIGEGEGGNNQGRN